MVGSGARETVEAEICDRLAVGRHDGAPFDATSGREGRRQRRVDWRPTLSAIDVVRVGASVRTYRTERRSAESVGRSIVYAPGVNNTAVSPPDALTEYRCGQPSPYDTNTSRSSAAQRRFAPPPTAGNESVGNAPLFHTSRMVPLAMWLTKIDHGSRPG